MYKVIRPVSVFLSLIMCFFAFSVSSKLEAIWIDYNSLSYASLPENKRVYRYDAFVDGINAPDSVEAFYFYSYAHVINQGNETIVVFLNTDTMNSLLASYENIISKYPNVSMISGPTYEYNCHSYAWHNQNYGTNKFWINEPIDAYLSDESYEQVTTPVVGDVVCYMDSRGTQNDYSDDACLHSAIIVAILSGTSNGECGNSDLYIVQSKWGGNGLYQHNGYECPYTSYNDDSSQDKAEYLTFFRKKNHTHSFTTYTQLSDSNNSVYHKKVCSTCGEIIYEHHTWVEYIIGNNIFDASPNYVPEYRCDKCGVTSIGHPY